MGGGRVRELLNAQGIEAQRAETAKTGFVHDGPVGNADAPNLPHPSPEDKP